MLRLPRTVVVKPLILAVAVLALAGRPASAAEPPNWRGGGVGTTEPVGGVDVDSFAGRSTLLGRFTGEGFHVLNPDLTFVGQATWTASDGATLDVTYTGEAFFTGDPDYPFGFEAVLAATGGTGRLAGARGSAAMTGAFTGVPGELFFEVEGTLHPQGK